MTSIEHHATFDKDCEPAGGNLSITFDPYLAVSTFLTSYCLRKKCTDWPYGVLEEFWSKCSRTNSFFPNAEKARFGNAGKSKGKMRLCLNYSGAPAAEGRQAEPHTHIRKLKGTHELIFSCVSWLAVLLVGAYARRRRRRRWWSRATWRPQLTRKPKRGFSFRGLSL